MAKASEVKRKGMFRIMENILETLKKELIEVSEEHALSEIKAKYLGKKGLITGLSAQI